MSTYKSDFLNTLSTRGYIHQCSDESGLDDLALKGKIIAYIGFDCTAKSLHVGSLVQIMLLHWAQELGQKSIALMGSGTTRIGDPSGRDESRKMLTLEDIKYNKRGIRKVFTKFLKFRATQIKKRDLPQLTFDLATNKFKFAEMLDNAQWLARLKYLDMLRDVGQHFSVNRMLAMDSVKLRLDRQHELSFIEFNYMILQAYDFFKLAQNYDCNLQMGGSDQWGNIVNGIDLGRRMGTHKLFGLTSPLITTASGAKMGKTASGAVWLNADMLSPYDYSQFWRNTEDRDVVRFLKLFTKLPLDEIARLKALGGSEINEAKKILAKEATALLHGRKAAEEASETARKTFEEGQSAIGLPTIFLDLNAGVGVLHANVVAGFALSNSDARRSIQGGAVRVNDIVVTDERMLLTLKSLNSEGVIKLSMGKKKHALIKPKQA